MSLFREKSYIFIILLTIFLIIGFILNLYLPRSLNVALSYEDSLSIEIIHRRTYAIFEHINGSPVTRPDIESNEYFFERGMPEFDKIINLLDNFSYHRPLSTLFNDNFGRRTSEGNGDHLQIRFIFPAGEFMDLWLIDTGGHNTLIRIVENGIVYDRTYRIGYWGNRRISELFFQVLEIIQ